MICNVHVASLICFALFASKIAMANVPCKRPFAGRAGHFFLHEALDCKGDSSTSYKLRVSDDESVPSAASPYLVPSCDGKAKSFDLKWGKIQRGGAEYDFIVSFSQSLNPESTERLSVVNACDGKIRGHIETKAGGAFTDSEGEAISTDYQLFTANSSTPSLRKELRPLPTWPLPRTVRMRSCCVTL